MGVRCLRNQSEWLIMVRLFLNLDIHGMGIASRLGGFKQKGAKQLKELQKMLDVFNILIAIESSTQPTGSRRVKKRVSYQLKVIHNVICRSLREAAPIMNINLKQK
jgi:hypothetical protein